MEAACLWGQSALDALEDALFGRFALADSFLEPRGIGFARGDDCVKRPPLRYPDDRLQPRISRQ